MSLRRVIRSSSTQTNRFGPIQQSYDAKTATVSNLNLCKLDLNLWSILDHNFSRETGLGLRLVLAVISLCNCDRKWLDKRLVSAVVSAVISGSLTTYFRTLLSLELDRNLAISKKASLGRIFGSRLEQCVSLNLDRLKMSIFDNRGPDKLCNFQL